MFRKALPALAAGVLTVAAALGAASPASASGSAGAQAHAAGHRGLVWTYYPDQYYIKINDRALFATEFCLGAPYPTTCAAYTTQCAKTTGDIIGPAWFSIVTKTGTPKCPRSAGTPNSQLGQAMAAVTAHWT